MYNIFVDIREVENALMTYKKIVRMREKENKLT